MYDLFRHTLRPLPTGPFSNLTGGTYQNRPGSFSDTRHHMDGESRFRLGHTREFPWVLCPLSDQPVLIPLKIRLTLILFPIVLTNYLSIILFATIHLLVTVYIILHNRHTHQISHNSSVSQMRQTYNYIINSEIYTYQNINTQSLI